MKRSYRLLALASVLAAIIGAVDQAEAQNRGGKMVYARNADSLFLDPVLLERNVDIWVLSNLYDTLLGPSADGLHSDPHLPAGWGSVALTGIPGRWGRADVTAVG